MLRSRLLGIGSRSHEQFAWAFLTVGALFMISRTGSEAELLAAEGAKASEAALGWAGPHEAHRCWERLPSAAAELAAAFAALRAAGAEK